MYHIVLVSLTLLIVACKDANPSPNGVDPIVIGHRGMGMGSSWPENSLISIERAIELDVGGIEMDVQLTSDNQFVLFHDGDLKAKSTCEGALGDFTLAELQNCRLESATKKAYIPALSEVFDLMEGTDLIAFIDTKVPRGMTTAENEAYFKRYNKALDSLLDQYTIDNNIFVEGDRIFHESFASNYDLKRVMTSSDMSHNIMVGLDVGAVGVGIAEKNVSLEEIQQAHDEGFFVVCWSLTTKNKVKKSIDKGADYLQSDCVKYAVDQTK